MATISDKAIDPHDYIGFDALLSEDEKSIRDAVREVVREQILPEVGDWFDKGILPREPAMTRPFRTPLSASSLRSH